MPAVDVAAVTRPDTVGGLVAKHRGVNMLVEGEEAAVGSGKPDKWMVDDEQIVRLGQLLHRKVGEVLQATRFPDDAHIRLHGHVGLGRGNHAVMPAGMVPTDSPQLNWRHSGFLSLALRRSCRRWRLPHCRSAPPTVDLAPCPRRIPAASSPGGRPRAGSVTAPRPSDWQSPPGMVKGGAESPSPPGALRPCVRDGWWREQVPGLPDPARTP